MQRTVRGVRDKASCLRQRSSQRLHDFILAPLANKMDRGAAEPASTQTRAEHIRCLTRGSNERIQLSARVLKIPDRAVVRLKHKPSKRLHVTAPQRLAAGH